MLALSAFVVYFGCIGAAVTPLGNARDRFERAALCLGTGLLVNYWLMLTTQPFVVVFTAGGVLAVVGLVRLARTRPLDGSRPRVPAATTAVAALVATLLLAYYFLILADPITAWDARSVWFFHARAIWLEGALRGTGWTHPSIVFSSPDYPKLVPALGAQLGYMKGYWNEFFPKGSLFVLLVPAVLWIVSFRQRAASFVLLVVALFLGQVEWLSNGYMDAYVVVYSALTLLFAGRYLREWRGFDLLSAGCALGIVTCLKNEGLLFALAVVVSVPLVLWRQGGRSLALDIRQRVRAAPRRASSPSQRSSSGRRSPGASTNSRGDSRTS